jgi:hypothetical protein
LLTLRWYFDRIETIPTLVCISPNRIPEMKTNSNQEFCRYNGHDPQPETQVRVLRLAW